MIVPERVALRVLTKVVMGPQGCHITEYKPGRDGYARISWVDDGRQVMGLVHRVAWVATYGPGSLPDPFTVDHVECQNRRCINPAHLRLLTHSQNAARHEGRDWPLDECANGHKLAEHWRRADGADKGYCLPCQVDQTRVWRAEHPEKVAEYRTRRRTTS